MLLLIENRVIVFLLQGGLVYIVVNGTLRIYQKQLNAIERRTRIIIDYPESEVEESV